MPSTYLTSRDLDMVARVLEAEHKDGQSLELDRLSARVVIKRLANGTRDERRLQIELKQFVKAYQADISDIDRWDDEGGALSRKEIQ